MSQIGGEGPWCDVDVVAQGEELQGGWALDATVWDGGEVVVVEVHLL